MKKIFFFSFLSFCLHSFGQDIQNNPGSNHANKMEQLGTILPTPNAYRTASGAPGPQYWQQQADYEIKCNLDEKNLRLNGSEKITYTNNSPDPLSYLWLQLDENEHSSTLNAGYQESTAAPRQLMDKATIENWEENKKDNGYNVKILKLTDGEGRLLKYTINKTMLRINLPKALLPKQKIVLQIQWQYNIVDRISKGGRGGYEYFPEDGNHIFTMAQWYPRLCVYSDFQGWQNHQFTGRGEFALGFGNFKVEMTVPADHIVMATGECQNYENVLSSTQQKRWQQAKTAKEPIEIVTLAEAKMAEQTKAKATKTWIFKADNVRDFAWGSSRKFIWDAMFTPIENKKVLCMSAYGKEAYNLYRKYSTKVIAHTLKTYSKFTVPYPYPVAQSIEASNGMEYPMICFNYGRTEKDGTYTENIKNGMIGVIIHEVGHNFFPMIINSDERQWSWMDEGLNTFVQYLAESSWDDKFPSRRGPAYAIVDYMKLPKDQLEPIMTNSENIIYFGPNAYSKPATALNILRETIMGRELFDFAFQEYAKRWAFKHPTPADFFRTMEDASGEDLDWFWRGWFYSTDPVDIAIDSVKHFSLGTEAVAQFLNQWTEKQQKITPPATTQILDISLLRNKMDSNFLYQTNVDTALRDFYWHYSRGLIPYDSTYTYKAITKKNVGDTLSVAEQNQYANKHLYEVSFSNKGGLLMPIIIQFILKDGTKYTEKIPVHIWRKNEKNVVKVFVTDQEVEKIILDPMRETADINEQNNVWPLQAHQPSKLMLYKSNPTNRRNPNQNSVNPMQAFRLQKN